MPFNYRLPVFNLSSPERLWLQEVYNRNKTGKRFSFEHVRVTLEGQIPNDFRYESIDKRLLEQNGTSITILGIIALEPNNDITDKINRIALAIRQLIIEDVDRSDISVDQISTNTGFTINEVSLFLHLLNLTGAFSSGSSYEQNTIIYKSIRVGGNEAVFNNYMEFPGVETLIVNMLNSYGPQPGPGFSQEEIFTANQKLDLILEKLEENFTGNILQWSDLKNDISEMRNHYSLPKKNWLQMLAGKLTEWTFSGLVSETISKEIVKFFSGIIRRIGV